MDGKPVEYVGQLQQLVGFRSPGDVVKVDVLRKGGVRKEFSVRLVAQPADNATQVSANDGAGNNGDELSGSTNRLGIAIEPLTQEDAAQDPRLLRVARSGGALVVTDVSPDGPAYRKLFGNGPSNSPDLILQVNGTPVHTRTEFRTAMQTVRPGGIATLQVLRRFPDGWDTAVVRVRAP